MSMKFTRLFSVWRSIVFLGLLLGLSASGHGAWLVPQEQLRFRVENLQTTPTPDTIQGERFSAAAALQRFYTGRGFTPVWSLIDRRRIGGLLEAIEESLRHGLDPADYHLQAIRKLLSANSEDAASVVDLELLASDAWLMLASHYAVGRLNPRQVDNQWHASRKSFDAVQALEQAVKENALTSALRRLLPTQAGYRRLVELLARLRSQPDWPAVSVKGALKAGTTATGIAALQRRLLAAGDLVVGKTPNDLYDEVTEAALKDFQRQHGLNPDGVIGAGTAAALNATRQQRIRQVMVNLERWRWLPEQLGKRHIRVNIADFSVEAWEDGRPALTMKAIIGRDYRQTPVFSGNMSYLVFNPYWEVPPSIAVKDKLPLLRNDPGELLRSGFEVLARSGLDSGPVDSASINWNAVDSSAFPYRLRQKPGPQNALGRVKLMFPNPYNVYLHDTPERHLFDKDNRAYSSGCIRVQKPLELVVWVLAGQAGWNLERVGQTVASGETKTVSVSPNIPVHIEYRTAWVDNEGKPYFRADIYGRDERVDKALGVSRMEAIGDRK